MNKKHQQRLIYIAFCAITIAIALGLILYALQKNINLFLTPSELRQQPKQSNYTIRLGGMVKAQSVRRQPDSLSTEFIVTDFKHEVAVRYSGILPDLFQEGKGVVTEGHLNRQGIFIANLVLAKHDENYQPKKFS
jgi:cytochrome c-type biogenesis protein CcmE